MVLGTVEIWVQTFGLVVLLPAAWFDSEWATGGVILTPRGRLSASWLCFRRRGSDSKKKETPGGVVLNVLTRTGVMYRVDLIARFERGNEESCVEELCKACMC